MFTLLQTVAQMHEYFDREKASQIKETEERYNRYKENVLVSVAVCEALDSLGFKFPNSFRDVSGWAMAEPYIQVEDIKDFVKVHKVVGALTQGAMYPDRENVRKRLVNVQLIPKNEKFSHIKFIYKKKLPKPTEGGKCKLVRVRNSSVQIVCER